MTFFQDARNQIEHVTRPVLVLQTLDGPFVPLSAAEHLCAQLPDARMEMLATKGHFPHETVPDSIVTAMRRFLAGDSL